MSRKWIMTVLAMLGMQISTAETVLQNSNEYRKPDIAVFSSGNVDGGEEFASVLAIGDFNDNGMQDIVIGSPQEEFRTFVGLSLRSGNGVVRVAYDFERDATQDLPATFSQVFSEFDVGGALEVDAGFGAVLTPAFVDSDDYQDLIIGVPLADVQNGGTQTDAGEVYVVYGSIAGLDLSTAVRFDRSSVTGLNGAFAGDQFGFAVARGCTYSGNSEIHIGIPFADINGQADAGAVAAVSFSGRTPLTAQEIDQTNFGNLNNEAGDEFGAALTPAGCTGTSGQFWVGIPGEGVSGVSDAGAIWDVRLADDNTVSSFHGSETGAFWQGKVHVRQDLGSGQERLERGYSGINVAGDRFGSRLISLPSHDVINSNRPFNFPAVVAAGEGGTGAVFFPKLFRRFNGIETYNIPPQRIFPDRSGRVGFGASSSLVDLDKDGTPDLVLGWANGSNEIWGYFLSTSNGPRIEDGTADFIFSKAASNTTRFGSALATITPVDSDQMLVVGHPGQPSFLDVTQGSAHFVFNEYDVNVAITSGSGSITSPSPDDFLDCPATTCSAEVPQFETLRLSATPAQYFQFDGWAGCPSADENLCTLLVTENTSLAARFARRVDRLDIDQGGDGTGTLEYIINDGAAQLCNGDCSIIVSAGTNLKFVATAGDRSDVVWTGEPCASNAVGFFCEYGDIDGSASMAVDFVLNSYRVEVNTVAGNGTVSGGSISDCRGFGTGTACTTFVDAGNAVSLQATPDDGWIFAGWADGASSCGTTPTCNLAPSGDTVIGAMFAEASTTEYTVSVDPVGVGNVIVAAEGGTVPLIDCPDGASCSATVAAGTKLILQAFSEAGFSFEQWDTFGVNSGCDGSVDNPCLTAGLDGDLQITPVYGSDTPGMHVVSALPNANADILITDLDTDANLLECNAGASSCSTSVADGTRVRVQALTSAGYGFVSWSLCTETICSRSESNPIDTGGLNQNFTVEVAVELLSVDYTVTVTPNPNALIIVTDETGSTLLLDCPDGGLCSANIPAGTALLMQAFPKEGFTFDSWENIGPSDHCQGSSDNPCTTAGLTGALNIAAVINPTEPAGDPVFQNGFE